MMSRGFPPLGAIARVLRTTTERLALELGNPRPEAPVWSNHDWRIARAAAALHGIAPLLGSTLRWAGPPGWQAFLAGQSAHSVARYTRIRDALEAIGAEARCVGVALMPLKGAALYALGLYPPGQRPMGDIDFLVRDADADAAVGVLQRCGYEWGFDVQRHRVFRPCGAPEAKVLRIGEHIDNPIKIEIHSHISERLPMVDVDITLGLLDGGWAPGLNPYPSPLALFRHLLLHAAGNMRARALRAVQLHDIALLARSLQDADWERLRWGEGSGATPWWAAPPLLLAARYYPGAAPQAVVQRLLDDCPPLLAWLTRRHDLTHVSWSNLRVQAFPGVEWARSAGEVIRYMRTRILPDGAARAELRQAADEIPDCSTVPWYGVPHAERILRWLCSRPPRVQTLLSVRAALAFDE